MFGQAVFDGLIDVLLFKLTLRFTQLTSGFMAGQEYVCRDPQVRLGEKAGQRGFVVEMEILSDLGTKMITVNLVPHWAVLALKGVFADAAVSVDNLPKRKIGDSDIWVREANLTFSGHGAETHVQVWRYFTAGKMDEAIFRFDTINLKTQEKFFFREVLFRQSFC